MQTYTVGYALQRRGRLQVSVSYRQIFIFRYRIARYKSSDIGIGIGTNQNIVMGIDSGYW